MAIRAIAVDLDDGKAGQAFEQRAGQGRQAGADFDHAIIGRRSDRAHDGGNHAFIGQEVLTETLAGLMPGHGQGHWL